MVTELIGPHYTFAAEFEVGLGIVLDGLARVRDGHPDSPVQIAFYRAGPRIDAMLSSSADPSGPAC